VSHHQHHSKRTTEGQTHLCDHHTASLVRTCTHDVLSLAVDLNAFKLGQPAPSVDPPLIVTVVLVLLEKLLEPSTLRRCLLSCLCTLGLAVFTDEIDDVGETSSVGTPAFDSRLGGAAVAAPGMEPRPILERLLDP